VNQAVGYVYAIENTVNNRCYIGSATDYKSRWNAHRSSLRRGKHHSFILQRAWDKYGEDAFAFKVLVICAKEQRIEYENRLMPLQSYNILRTAKEQLVRGGWKHMDAFRQKMSAIHKGKKLTNEHRQKLAEVARTRKYDSKRRNNCKERQLKLMQSEEYTKSLTVFLEKARKVKSDNCAKKTNLVYAEVQNGLSVRDACKLHKISEEAFYKHAKAMSLPRLGHANRTKKITSANEAKAKNAYSLLVVGYTITNACKEAGIATNTLYRYMQTLGLPKIGHKNRKHVV
jgi:group I intron endonuclease